MYSDQWDESYGEIFFFKSGMVFKINNAGFPMLFSMFSYIAVSPF